MFRKLFLIIAIVCLAGVSHPLTGFAKNKATERMMIGIEYNPRIQTIRQVQHKLLAYLKLSPAQYQHRFKHVPYIVADLSPHDIRRAKRYPYLTLLRQQHSGTVALAESIPIVTADHAWNSGYTGEDQVIVIADTGVDSQHPFLENRIVDEACFSTAMGSNEVSLCPNGNDTQFGAGAAAPCAVSDECEHGTHVAGIAAGLGEDFSGVAPEANIVAIQIFHQENNANECGDDPAPCIGWYEKDLIDAVEWVYGDFPAAEAINLSIGGGVEHTTTCDDEPIDDIIFDLRNDNQTATVISSGNDSFTNGLSYPACVASAISVGATEDSDDDVRAKSNSASYLDLLAPGTDIYSSIPGGGYVNASGTSMAAPHVAGAIAVLRSKDSSLSVSDMEEMLKDTGKLITDSKSDITTPRINVQAALYGECAPTTSSDWTVSSSCSIVNDITFAKNVTIESGVTVVIGNDAVVDVDFENHFLKIKDGGGVFIQDQSKIY